VDSRATRTRLSVLPVFIALLFNVMAPVVAMAVPQVVPSALAPQVATAASDPEHVSFTLEGCRDPSVDLEATNFICADGDYTPGNLGKTWNELDLVPHRLFTTSGTQATVTTTYTIGITADHMDAGAPGYDVLSAPTIDPSSDPSCSIVVGPETVISPGVGGIDESLGRLLTITQDPGTTCLFNWYERLALGSHLFPGSSLHTNKTNQEFETSGVGAADVSIPVNEILPQELSKDMTAEQGQAYGWTIEKSAEPGSLDFLNTCADTTGALAMSVDITVTWTRSGPTASGDTTITTHVYATNPAHRTITVQATDNIYQGTGQAPADLIHTVVGSPVDVPAGAEDMLVLTHTFAYSGDATSFNDVATATYTDLVTGIPVPGQTSASASATVQASSGAIENASVVVSDTESITGNGLTFSVADPSVGAFTGGYVADASTTGPVGWEFTATDSGSVTFEKTVYVDGPMITSGQLSDTATITGDGDVVLDSAELDVDITTDALVDLTINKTIPAGSLRAGESVTFDFDITGPDDFADTASITIEFDDLTGSTTLSGLAPGEYTVSEQPQAGWADHSPQVALIALPECDDSVSFNNTTLAPDLDLTKEADDVTVTAGDPIGFTIELTNSDAVGTGTAKDVEIHDALPFGDGIDWEIDSVTGIGGFDPTGLCSITGSPPDEDLDCILGDLAPGEGVSIAISSDTTGDSCGEYENEATATASNHEELKRSDTTTVLCPSLEIDKLTSTPVINAGEEASYTITISNENGDAAATDVDLTDTLPSGLTWTEDSDDCDINAGVLTCLDLTIPAGESFSVTVTGLTDAGECPSIINRATFTSGNGGSGESAPVDEGTVVTVNCPDLEVVKEQVDANGDPTDEPVDAGLTAYFAIHVTNHGPGTAFDVDVLDFAPDGTVWTVVDDGGFDCPTTIDDSGDSCTADVMVVGTATILLSYLTTEADCGTLVNNVEVSASNEPQAKVGLDNESSATIVVECPGLNLIKTADESPIVAGDEASFTITLWNTGPGDVLDATLHEALPAGLTWDFEVVSGDATDADCDVASSLVAGGEPSMSIDCAFGTLGVTTMADGIVIRFFATTDATDCGLLENTATADGSNLELPLTASASILVRCPTLVIDKVANAEVITISGPANALVATPSVVTWTLTYTLTDGPVTGAVITDPIPVGFTFLSASNGGTFANGIVTWTFPGELTSSGFVTFQTTVNPVTIPRTGQTNTATIDSNETAPDTGQDSVTVVVIPPPLGGNPPPLPNTATATGLNGEPVTVPIELLVAFFIGSLGAVALANVKASNRRR
jgi:uncharacterized repeat protein (TIGR01451 family)